MEIDRSYIVETPGCFLLYVGGTYTLPYLWCRILSWYYSRIKIQFQHISLAHCDLLKRLFWTSRHRRLLFHLLILYEFSQNFCRRLTIHKSIHFQEIRSGPDLNRSLHRTPNNFCKTAFAFPASKLWDMLWTIMKQSLLLSLTGFKRQMLHYFFLKYLYAWILFCFLTMLWPHLLNSVIRCLVFCFLYVPIPLSYIYHTWFRQLWCFPCKKFKTLKHWLVIN